MLQTVLGTLSQAAHLAAILLILYGAFLVVGAMLSNANAMSFVRGFAFVIAGTWLAGIVG